MRDLLERWAALEPERCHEVEYGDGTALAVVVEGETLYADSPGRVKADQAMSRGFILAATIEAIEARGWWLDIGARRSESGRQYAATVNMTGEPFYKVGWGKTVSEALLRAYLKALEAEAAT